MWTPGTKVSAIGHAGFIGWLLLGWGLSADPLPFEVSQVSVVSGDEYAALVAASAPDAAPLDPDTPVVAAPTQSRPPAARPDPAPAPEPEVEPAPAPAPPASPPAAEPDAPLSDTPQEAPADRVAAVPTAPPPPDADTAAVVQDQTSPDAAPDAPQVDAPTAQAAPEDTATTIVPEDAVPSGAVVTSRRPAPRPARPIAEAADEAETTVDTPPAPPEPDPEPQPDPAPDPAVAAALAEVTAPAANIPVGPPMTGSEKEGFRVAVNDCWTVDPGSVAARVTVEVGFSLDQNGRVTGPVELLSADGDTSATQTAFQAARRAILRCQTQSGYDLPAEKYGQWKDVVIIFDPSGMRLR